MSGHGGHEDRIRTGEVDMQHDTTGTHQNKTGYKRKGQKKKLKKEKLKCNRQEACGDEEENSTTGGNKS